MDAGERAGVVTGRRVGLVTFLGGFVALGVVAGGALPDVWPVRVAILAAMFAGALANQGAEW